MSRRLSFAGIALAMSLAVPALAQDNASPALRLAQANPHAGHGAMAASPIILSPAWSRATAPGAKVAGGFFTIENKGAVADRLIGGAAEISSIFEVHEMAIVDGVMKMRALDKGLPVPPGGAVELKPGSYHIMFIDLKRQLKEGETFKGELTFEKAGKMTVEFKVMPIGAKAANPHQGH